MPGGTSLVYLQGIETKDFWLVDLATNKTRKLTDLSDRGYLNTFDITPDGKHLVFDRAPELGHRPDRPAERVVARGSWLAARGSWLVVRGSTNNEPRATSNESPQLGQLAARCELNREVGVCVLPRAQHRFVGLAALDDVAGG